LDDEFSRLFSSGVSEFIPTGLVWYDEKITIGNTKWRYYGIKNDLKKVKKKLVVEHPAILEDVLRLAANAKVEECEPKQCFRIGLDGHLVLLPHRTLKFGDIVNFDTKLKMITYLFGLSNPTKFGDLYSRLLRATPRDFKTLLEPYVIQHDTIVPPLDLSGASTLAEFCQRLADHPDHIHLVQDEHGEIREEIEFEVPLDSHIAQHYQSLDAVEEEFDSGGVIPMAIEGPFAEPFSFEEFDGDILVPQFTFEDNHRITMDIEETRTDGPYWEVSTTTTTTGGKIPKLKSTETFMEVTENTKTLVSMETLEIFVTLHKEYYIVDGEPVLKRHKAIL